MAAASIDAALGGIAVFEAKGNDGKRKLVLHEKGLLDYVEIDQVAVNKWMVTNTLTGERHPVDAMDVQVERCAETHSLMVLVLQPDDTWQVLDANKLFPIGLYEADGTGELYLHAGGPAERAMPWSLLQSRYRAGKMRIRLTSSTAEGEVAVYIFRQARAPKQSMYWSLVDLYSFLGMTSYKGVPSKWAWRWSSSGVQGLSHPWATARSSWAPTSATSLARRNIAPLAIGAFHAPALLLWDCWCFCGIGHLPPERREEWLRHQCGFMRVSCSSVSSWLHSLRSTVPWLSWFRWLRSGKVRGQDQLRCMILVGALRVVSFPGSPALGA